MDIGLHKNLPAALYHAAVGASASRLKDFARSPAHCRRAMLNPAEPTPAMRFGTLCHDLVLEPGQARHVVVPAGIDRRTKDGKARWADLIAEAEGRDLVAADDMAAAEAIRDAVMAHPAARMLLDGRTATELSAGWDDAASGVRCKMRTDALSDIDGMVLCSDLKTTQDAGPDGLWKALADYRYDLSACHYQHGLAAHGVAVDAHYLLMVEKEPPYAVGVYEIPRAVIEAAEVLRAALLSRWAECEASKAWPAYSTEIQTSEPPTWFARKFNVNAAFAAEGTYQP